MGNKKVKTYILLNLQEAWNTFQATNGNEIIPYPEDALQKREKYCFHAKKLQEIEGYRARIKEKG